MKEFKDNIFELYEETKPKEVEVKKEETLFEPEVKEENQTVTLPEGFEENLINKITEAIMGKLNKPEGGDE